MTFNLEWATAPESGGVTGSYDSNVIVHGRRWLRGLLPHHALRGAGLLQRQQRASGGGWWTRWMSAECSAGPTDA